MTNAPTKRDIICPCGHHLGTTINSTGGGTKYCSKCKKRVKFELSKDDVKTYYEE